MHRHLLILILLLCPLQWAMLNAHIRGWNEDFYQAKNSIQSANMLGLRSFRRVPILLVYLGPYWRSSRSNSIHSQYKIYHFSRLNACYRVLLKLKPPLESLVAQDFSRVSISISISVVHVETSFLNRNRPMIQVIRSTVDLFQFDWLSQVHKNCRLSSNYRSS